MSLDDRHVAADEYQLLARLMALGAVIWVGKPGVGKNEFRRPNGWQSLDGSGNKDQLADFVVGQDCIALNTGLPVAVIDVDTRNGGDVDKVRALLAGLKVRIFVEIDTPGGGKHFYVAGHPDLPTTHSSKDKPELPDYPGVDIQSHGANVFLPGTCRPKYDGRGYAVVFDNLDQLALLGKGDDGGPRAQVGANVSDSLQQVGKAVDKTIKKATDSVTKGFSGFNGHKVDSKG